MVILPESDSLIFLMNHVLFRFGGAHMVLDQLNDVISGEWKRIMVIDSRILELGVCYLLII